MNRTAEAALWAAWQNLGFLAGLATGLALAAAYGFLCGWSR